MLFRQQLQDVVKQPDLLVRRRTSRREVPALLNFWQFAKTMSRKVAAGAARGGARGTSWIFSVCSEASAGRGCVVSQGGC